jgi:hypothetical protein
MLLLQLLFCIVFIYLNLVVLKNHVRFTIRFVAVVTSIVAIIYIFVAGARLYGSWYGWLIPVWMFRG